MSDTESMVEVASPRSETIVIRNMSADGSVEWEMEVKTADDNLIFCFKCRKSPGSPATWVVEIENDHPMVHMNLVYRHVKMEFENNRIECSCDEQPDATIMLTDAMIEGIRGILSVVNATCP
jgi:hypothetical protein